MRIGLTAMRFSCHWHWRSKLLKEFSWEFKRVKASSLCLLVELETSVKKAFLYLRSVKDWLHNILRHVVSTCVISLPSLRFCTRLSASARRPWWTIIFSARKSFTSFAKALISPRYSVAQLSNDRVRRSIETKLCDFQNEKQRSNEVLSERQNNV